MTLARFGAEVIKVAAPGAGDPIRSAGPFHGPKGINAERQTEDDLSVRFLKRSEGVKSVTLDLKDPEGRRTFLELAKRSDVVIENLSPGSMKRMALGYEDISVANPGIVYCFIAGYGQTGPCKDLPAHDHQIEAMSGIMDMNGPADGAPTRVGIFVGDLATPLIRSWARSATGSRCSVARLADRPERTAASSTRCCDRTLSTPPPVPFTTCMYSDEPDGDRHHGKGGAGSIQAEIPSYRSLPSAGGRRVEGVRPG